MTFTIINGEETCWMDLESVDDLCELEESYGPENLRINFWDRTITIVKREG